MRTRTRTTKTIAWLGVATALAACGDDGGAATDAGGDATPATGEALWARRVDGRGSAYGIAIDADGGILVAGTFTGTLDCGTGVMTSAGLGDGYLARYSRDGACEWAQRIGGTGEDAAVAVAIEPGTSVVYVVGRFQGTLDAGTGPITGAGLADGFVIAYAPDASPLWARSLGGTAFTSASGVAAGTAGPVVVGTGNGAIDLGGGEVPGTGPGFAVRLATDGAYVGGRRLPVALGGVAIGRDDQVVLGGAFSDTIDLGARTLTARGPSDGVVLRFTPTWVNTQAVAIGDGRGTRIDAIAVDGDAVIAVGHQDPTGLLRAGALVERVAADGTLGLGLARGDAASLGIASVAVATDGDLVVTGAFADGTLDLGCGPLVAAFGTGNDVFLARLDRAGGCRWARRIASNADDFGYGVAVQRDGHVALGCQLGGSASFGVETLLPTHDREPCVARFRP